MAKPNSGAGQPPTGRGVHRARARATAFVRLVYVVITVGLERVSEQPPRQNPALDAPSRRDKSIGEITVARPREIKPDVDEVGFDPLAASVRRWTAMEGRF